MQSPQFRQHIICMLGGALGILALLSIAFAIKRLFLIGKRRSTPANEQPGRPPNLTPVPLSDPMPPPIGPTINRRATVGPRFIVGAALVVIIVVAFLFSVRSYSGILAHGSAHPAQPVLIRPEYERGIIYPQWNHDGYGVLDTTWQQGVGTIKTQTGAQWIEIPVLFSQATSSSTTVGVSASTPGLQSFTEGIEKAHALGYKVFFVPLMQVREPGGWSGTITFKTAAQEQAWFDSYWNTIQPYVVAATNEHVEQMAIGAELQILQQIVPDPLWNQLIARIRSIFKQPLTYNMNWSSLDKPLPTWLENPGLTYIGISTYIPLLNTPKRVDPKDMPALWQQKIKTKLDTFATQIKKQVLITEIGYRNTADALYQTWLPDSTARPDSEEQAGAYEAALSNVFNDPQIAGTFFWGWDDVGMFAIADQPAVQVLQKWYTLTQE